MEFEYPEFGVSSQSLATWDMKEASQGEPRNRGPEFGNPALFSCLKSLNMIHEGDELRSTRN